ncbi:hypothetical protein MUY14_08925 [Amycolatopsis sp. FBCC-B4732]|uniref:hypothetical protein n=1 Tax=Amycolatopsis sp. FBCC-B4732 TaxID=3079339 RepID=UPI001FF14BD3|nr:hypothetical protein [Amycolatopsis sp. FBCC-B4732]UOX90727.1 hypothetical protein MUY14_08925 [Amycolatopsis sp. FBCC-B4732]
MPTTALGALRLRHRVRRLIVHLVRHLVAHRSAKAPDPPRRMLDRLRELVAPTSTWPWWVCADACGCWPG